MQWPSTSVFHVVENVSSIVNNRTYMFFVTLYIPVAMSCSNKLIALCISFELDLFPLWWCINSGDMCCVFKIGSSADRWGTAFMTADVISMLSVGSSTDSNKLLFSPFVEGIEGTGYDSKSLERLMTSTLLFFWEADSIGIHGSHMFVPMTSCYRINDF